MVENEPERGGYVNLVYNPCLVETENKSEAADKSDTEDKYVASSSAWTKTSVCYLINILLWLFT